MLTGERPERNRQSQGNACDCRVPVAHLLVALRQRRLTEPGRRRHCQILFPAATSLCDLAHFFPVATRLPCGCLARNVRPDLENAQQKAEDKKAGDQIKAFEQLLQEI